MSTATSFRYHRPFPFCVNPPAYSSPTDIVRGLTLDQVMTFYWSISQVSFTLSGTATNIIGGVTTIVSGSGSIGLLPFSLSGDFVSIDEWLWPDDISFAPSWQVFSSGSQPLMISDVPSEVRPPKSRVCCNQFTYSATGTSSAGTNAYPGYFDINFSICSDDENPGFYAIEWYLEAIVGFNSPSTSLSGFGWFNASNTESPGLTNVLNSGSFVIAGVSFDWVCRDSGTGSGGDLAVVSDTFDY